MIDKYVHRELHLFTAILVILNFNIEISMTVNVYDITSYTIYFNISLFLYYIFPFLSLFHSFTSVLSSLFLSSSKKALQKHNIWHQLGVVSDDYDYGMTMGPFAKPSRAAYCVRRFRASFPSLASRSRKKSRDSR